MKTFVSRACRRCCAGWWGSKFTVPTLCPYCGHKTHVTGEAYVVPIPSKS